jgi:tetratricopeptide (TPR) repeat protein
MPEPSKKALVPLERALALDPNYALAHAYAAECYHSLFLRGGLHEEHRIASVQHADAAITHGQDDALALSFAGFVIGMDKHDRPAAFAALEASLAVSPSLAHTYIQGSVILAIAGESERAIEWAERGFRLSPLNPWRSSAFFAIAIAHFIVGAVRRRPPQPASLSNSVLGSACLIWCLLRAWRSWVKPRRLNPLRPAFCNCSRCFVAVGNFLAGILIQTLLLPWEKRSTSADCQNSDVLF